DLSLVDPDNRRPVDFAQRRHDLEAMRAIADRDDPEPAIAQLCTAPDDGRAKTWITWRALQLRRAHPELFRAGDYTGLSATGARLRHVVAFARRKDDDVLVVVSARLFAQLGIERGALPVAKIWRDTAIALPPWGRNLALRDALTGRVHMANGEVLQLEQVF